MATLHEQSQHTDIRSFLFGLLNKELLVFVFFLAISTAFWFMSSLNDFYEQDIRVKVEITDVPQNIVITEGLPDSMRVTVRDKGFNLINYTVNEGLPTLRFAFSNYAKGNGRGMVTTNDIQKMVRARLSETGTIVAVKADHYDFYYCNGTRKRVPLLFDGLVRPGTNYYISRMVLTPDSVTVMAGTDALDTINAVYIEPVELMDVTASSTRTVKLQQIKGARMETADAKLSIMTDQLTEVTVKVPIRAVNVPDGMTLKTFPAQVDVRVTVGVKSSGIVKAERFVVAADYNSLATNTDKHHIQLHITQQPRGIIKAALVHGTVEYLIENDK